MRIIRLDMFIVFKKAPSYHTKCFFDINKLHVFLFLSFLDVLKKGKPLIMYGPNIKKQLYNLKK
ncbi:hypothetical protein BMT_05625 [Priestia megaterium NBRC 15308 = ATCC 14581]|nr:hypothetical protein BMT_05625 [Priestia megaterium NBRC 15308 = ATCC 14581]